MATHSPSLTRFAWLSVGAAVVTITLKMGAFALTGSIGLLSDALESVVNFVAAVAAVIALTVAAKEPDAEHAFGHDKAEYFSSGFEGALVLLAAGLIAWTAAPRLFSPQPIEKVGIGLVVSIVASLINLLVARRLRNAGREHRSITLEADAQHLMADVWTSVGVIVGIALVSITGWLVLDAVIALIVAANIVWTGSGLVRRSMLGLLDTAMPENERATIETIFNHYKTADGIEVHAFRTRQAGARRFMDAHVLVPGAWTVHRGHRLLEAMEGDIRAAFPGIVVMTHLESLEDPASWEDAELDREEPAEPVGAVIPAGEKPLAAPR